MDSFVYPVRPGVPGFCNLEKFAYLCSLIEIWCNGSTTDFGSVCLGSNPSISTLRGFVKGPFFVIYGSHKTRCYEKQIPLSNVLCSGGSLVVGMLRQ